MTKLKDQLIVANPTEGQRAAIFTLADVVGVDVYDNTRKGKDGGIYRHLSCSARTGGRLQISGNSADECDSHYTWVSFEEFMQALLFYKPSIIKLTADYDAVVNEAEEVVEVGCQKIPFTKVTELFDILSKIKKK